MDQHALGSFIRARRESLAPEDVGLWRGPRRRVSGLRRDEVAALAGMSSDYLARIERGDGPQPSRQIIGALARALRLTVEERDHVLLQAGHLPPARNADDEHVNPGLLRILDALTDVPAQVMGPVGQTLAQNATAIALFGDETRFHGPERSAVYRWFACPGARSLYPEADHGRVSRAHVAQLQNAVARLGRGSAGAHLAAELHAASDEFARLWDSGTLGVRLTEQKRFLHPEIGTIDLYCQATVDPDSLQTLLILTATAGTPDREKLALLSVLGTSDMNLNGPR